MSWNTFESDKSGSEGGCIVRDEEHQLGARITLEEHSSAAPYAITCGIYGWMVHTRFFSERRQAEKAYFQMKQELAVLVDLIPDERDPELEEKIDIVTREISAFVERHP